MKSEQHEPAKRRSLIVLPASSVLAVLILGCGDSDEIRRYRAPKPAAVSALLDQTTAHSPLDSNTPQRMLGAIVLKDGQGWFFRINGDPARLERHLPGFRQWLESIRFEGDQPRWQLPDQWRQMPASGMRFATILPEPQDDGLELTVIPLPIEGDPNQGILANVNRWRGQLGLAPIREDQLSEATEAISLDGLTAIVVDFVSASRSSGVGSAEPPHRASPMAEPMPEDGRGSSIEFDTPEGWNSAPLVVSRGGITIRHEAAFEIVSGDRRLEFTLDRLPAAGSLLQNINRWRSQVGLEPVSPEELDQSTQKLDVGGVSADLVELVGDQETILGVVVVQGDQAWYFKLKGNSELAASERENFLALVRSVKFP